MDDRRTEGHDHTPFGGSFLDAFRSPPYPFPDIPPYNVKTLHFHGVPTTEDTQHAWGYTFTTVVLHDALGDAGTMRGLGLIYVPSRPRTIRSRGRATKRGVTWYLTKTQVDLRSVVSAHPFIRTRDGTRNNLVTWCGSG